MNRTLFSLPAKLKIPVQSRRWYVAGPMTGSLKLQNGWSCQTKLPDPMNSNRKHQLNRICPSTFPLIKISAPFPFRFQMSRVLFVTIAATSELLNNPKPRETNSAAGRGG
jgi:hypothetical protein